MAVESPVSCQQAIGLMQGVGTDEEICVPSCSAGRRGDDSFSSRWLLSGRLPIAEASEAG
jgi:hypothetical protein